METCWLIDPVARTAEIYEGRAKAGRPATELAAACLPGFRLPVAELLALKLLQQFARPLYHPEIGAITVDYLVQTYGWHSRHHVAHITRLREREGW